MDTGNKTNGASAISFGNESDKRTYTVMEVAVLLRISRTKAYELCNQELFRTIRIGRALRISKSSFDEWLDNQT